MAGNENIQIRAGDETLRGEYANMMRVTHTSEEFILDFVNILPTDAALTARIITSPGHMKRIIAALQENVQRYETQFGEIRAAKGPNGSSEGIGFKKS